MDETKKICLITNIGAHYRFPIFNEISNRFPCDFYIGDKINTHIKKFDYSLLGTFKKTLRNKHWGKFYWQTGSVSLINKDYQYYILDGEPFCLSSWVILLLAKIKGKETIAWTHGWYGREGRIKKILKKIFFSLHSKLMIYTEYAIDLMIKEGFDKEKLFCIANSLDSDREKNIRKQLCKSSIYIDHFHNSNPTIIYCGRIQKRKKLEVLLDCILKLKEEDFMVNTVFIGEDVDNVNLQEIATKKDIISQVWFYGPCYDENKLGELFYNATVCVSPGNVGLTAIHSLTFGCPVITHNNFPYQMPEFEAISANRTGDFYIEGNILDLKEKIKKWTSISQAEREQVRKNAFEEIDRKWNIHKQIEVLERVFES